MFLIISYLSILTELCRAISFLSKVSLNAKCKVFILWWSCSALHSIEKRIEIQTSSFCDYPICSTYITQLNELGPTIFQSVGLKREGNKTPIFSIECLIKIIFFTWKKERKDRQLKIYLTFICVKEVLFPYFYCYCYTLSLTHNYVEGHSCVYYI